MFLRRSFFHNLFAEKSYLFKISNENTAPTCFFLLNVLFLQSVTLWKKGYSLWPNRKNCQLSNCAYAQRFSYMLEITTPFPQTLLHLNTLIFFFFGSVSNQQLKTTIITPNVYMNEWYNIKLHILVHRVALVSICIYYLGVHIV